MASAIPPTSPTELKAIATSVLTALRDKRQFAWAASCMHKNIHAHHGSLPPAVGANQFMARWGKALEFMPGFNIEVMDVVAEVDEVRKAGGKVWVYSKIAGGRGGEERLSVDMITINEHGQIVETRDCQRVVVPANTQT